VTRPPEFTELVGDEGSPEELERLRRVHELLIQAGPPEELPPDLAHAPAPPPPAPVIALTRRKPATAIGIAAAAVLAALVVGYAVGARGNNFDAAFTVPMHGVGKVAAARGEVKIGQLDGAGNWPMLFTVSGLPRLPANRKYELYLTKNGVIAESCGAFVVKGGETETTVKLNAPYRLKNYSGWVVTAREASGATSRTPIVLRTARV
jgi:hypothetical protein